MYRPKTTLEQWRILQAVVDHGGYAKAADYLNKSQSSLNHAVAKLQYLLDVQLLEVKGRKAFLTPAGEVMLRRSRNLTDNVEALEALAVNINQAWEPEITLAIDLAFDKRLLYPALEEFLPECRGSRLTMIDTVLTGTDDAITQHKVNFSISLIPASAVPPVARRSSTKRIFSPGPMASSCTSTTASPYSSV